MVFIHSPVVEREALCVPSWARAMVEIPYCWRMREAPVKHGWAFVILPLLLLAFPAKAVEGLDPELMPILEGYAIECGKAAQLSRWAGIDTAMHESDFLMIARRNGASYPQLGQLQEKYLAGKQYAARRGYLDGWGLNMPEAKLSSIRKDLVNCLNFF